MKKNLKTQYTPKKKKICLEGHSGPGIETELGLVAHQLQTNSGLSSCESCFADQHFKIIPHTDIVSPLLLHPLLRQEHLHRVNKNSFPGPSRLSPSAKHSTTPQQTFASLAAGVVCGAGEGNRDTKVHSSHHAESQSPQAFLSRRLRAVSWGQGN